MMAVEDIIKTYLDFLRKTTLIRKKDGSEYDNSLKTSTDYPFTIPDKGSEEQKIKETLEKFITQHSEKLEKAKDEQERLQQRIRCVLYLKLLVDHSLRKRYVEEDDIGNLFDDYDRAKPILRVVEDLGDWWDYLKSGKKKVIVARGGNTVDNASTAIRQTQMKGYMKETTTRENIAITHLYRGTKDTIAVYTGKDRINRLALSKVAEELGISIKRTGRMSTQDLIDITGFPSGAISPIGLKRATSAFYNDEGAFEGVLIVDPYLLAMDTVHIAAGDSKQELGFLLKKDFFRECLREASKKSEYKFIVEKIVKRVKDEDVKGKGAEKTELKPLPEELETSIRAEMARILEEEGIPGKYDKIGAKAFNKDLFNKVAELKNAMKDHGRGVNALIEEIVEEHQAA